MMDATRLRAPAHHAGERQMTGRDTGSDPTVATIGSTNPIRLLLVDDKLIVREGVRAFLEERSGFDVVGQASSIAEAIASNIVPDVVITDLVLPDARGRDVVVALRNHFARAAIFVLTDVDHRSQVETIISEGVGGYVLKTATAEEFVSGLRSAALGVPYLQPALRPPRIDRPLRAVFFFFFFLTGTARAWMPPCEPRERSGCGAVLTIQGNAARMCPALARARTHQRRDRRLL